MLNQQRQAALLLFWIAEDADENDGRMQITRDIHIIDGDKTGFADLKLAPDDFANRALQQLANTLHSERGHLS